MTLEMRGGIPAEIADADDGKVRVVGYAAVFNQPANIAGEFREVIAPGAFRSALARGDDVVFLINHEGLPIARSTAGNLALAEDGHGLRIEAMLNPSDPDVARIVPKMRDGMLNQMSFAFRVSPGGQKWEDADGDLALRVITDVSLHDVSIVNTGAYAGTEIALRSLEEARREQRRRNFNAAAYRLRMKTNLDLRSRRIESKA